MKRFIKLNQILRNGLDNDILYIKENSIRSIVHLLGRVIIA